VRGFAFLPVLFSFLLSSFSFLLLDFTGRSYEEEDENGDPAVINLQDSGSVGIGCFQGEVHPNARPARGLIRIEPPCRPHALGAFATRARPMRYRDRTDSP